MTKSRVSALTREKEWCVVVYRQENTDLAGYLYVFLERNVNLHGETKRFGVGVKKEKSPIRGKG